MTVSKEEIAVSVDVAEWSWLRAHLERGGLIVIDGNLDLAEVASKIFNNDSETIERLIITGGISKPSVDQLALWDSQPTKLFTISIVSPYVIIQEQN
ncbi:MAG: hypothetical protein A2X80_00880 [Geobacteraceae bacterium GWB2_52_12]|nr:MAG: hypothetical protein A2X80_00880 [Geobacteraceae bacterium GWB2_52_12]